LINSLQAQGKASEGDEGVKGTVLLTTFESKHLEKQPSAVQNGIHLTPAAGCQGDGSLDNRTTDRAPRR